MKTINESDDLIDNILKSVSLKDRLEIRFTLNDYQNWKNGSYLGDKKKIRDEVKEVLEIVDGWVKDGMPKNKQNENKRRSK